MTTIQKKVRFFSDFCSSENCCDVMRAFHPEWAPDIELTAGDDYTHVVILNTCMPELVASVPRANVLGLAFEPRPYLFITAEFVAYARRHIGKYLVGDASRLGGEPFVEGFAYKWRHVLVPQFHLERDRALIRPPNMVSIMVSKKMWGPGNRYRHALARRILQSNLPIDIWGNGCGILVSPPPPPSAKTPNFRNIMSHIMQKPAVPKSPDPLLNPNDARIRGPFSLEEPFDGYAFHVAIENYQSGHYISEKILDPLVYGCTPVYLGSPFIETYFPGMVIGLTGNEDQDMALLARICADPLRMRKPIDLDHVLRVQNMSGEFV
jgi:hypothetical protein